MTGSPFSNVLGQDPDDSTFVNVTPNTRSDTSSLTDTRPVDDPTEPAGGLTVEPGGTLHEAGQDETAGDAASS